MTGIKRERLKKLDDTMTDVLILCHVLIAEKQPSLLGKGTKGSEKAFKQITGGL